ncbi:MAG: MipA/OmpV family protein [Acidobacteriota bacterium]|jgi:outer membrane protein|nr:MipA/OmpV family protein [Acidobacteriota bacterium]
MQPRLCKIIFFLLLLALLLAQYNPAFAQSEETDSPGTEMETAGEGQSAPQASGAQSGDNFSLALGAGVIVSPRPYVGADYRIFPIPSVEIDYKGWFFRGIRGGYGFIRTERFTASLYGQARFSGLESDSSPFLQGMEDRKKSMDAGIELSYRGRPVGFRFNYLGDVLGRNKGQEATFLVTSGVPLGRRGIVLAGIGPRWLSKNHVDYYYGVRAAEATPSRPAYSGRPAYNLDINITAIINVSSHWRWIAIMNREGFGAAIKESPIVDRNSSYAFITSLNYKF